ncbi:MAG TPA: prolipoprotein diacylglyceryl transferase family protein, partial [Chitinophagales bacterium]
GRTKNGVYFSFFFVAMFTVRFIIEFWKEPEGEQILPFISRTQSLSLPFIVVGILAFAYFYFTKPQRTQSDTEK